MRSCLELIKEPHETVAYHPAHLVWRDRSQRRHITTHSMARYSSDMHRMDVSNMSCDER